MSCSPAINRCTFRLAADDPGLRVALPETQIGIVPGFGGTQRLPRLVGLVKSLDLILAGKRIDARQALKIGLVNQVVPEAKLMDAALNMCERIGRNSPLSLKLSRIALDEGPHSSFEQILALEAEHLLACVKAGNQEKFVAHKLAEMKKKSDS